MIFYLSLTSVSEQSQFLNKADDLMRSQPEAFRTNLQPAWRGLTLAVSGMSPYDLKAVDMGARCFLGWSQERHWLMSEQGYCGLRGVASVAALGFRGGVCRKRFLRREENLWCLRQTGGQPVLPRWGLPAASVGLTGLLI
jgi:hypothetical protein